MNIIYALVYLVVYILSRETFKTLDKEGNTISKCLPNYQFIRKGRKEKYVYYQYWGNWTKYPNVRELEKLISGHIGKPVRVFFDRVLTVRVYKEKLPTLLEFPTELKKKNVSIGKGLDGYIYHDFEAYPHIIVAGTTGYGKSTFIRSLVKQINLLKLGETYIIDLKNDGDYVRTHARNIEQTHRLLKWIESKRDGKRRFIVVDEASLLYKPSFIDSRSHEGKMYLEIERMVTDIAQRGRSLKRHLIYATQYPTGDVVPKHIKQNIECRVAFRHLTEVASRVTLDESGAELLPRGLRGRALVKYDSMEEIQTFLVEKGEDFIDNDSFRETKERELDIISKLAKGGVMTAEQLRKVNAGGLGNGGLRNVHRVLGEMERAGIVVSKRYDRKIYRLREKGGFGMWEHTLMRNDFLIEKGWFRACRMEIPIKSADGEIVMKADAGINILGKWNFLEVDRRQDFRANREKIERYEQMLDDGLKFDLWVVCYEERADFWEEMKMKYGGSMELWKI